MVARKVSAAMRLPVSVGSTSYTPWGGVQLKGLRIEQVDEARAIVSDPFFSAASFGASLRLSSLWSDQVVIDRLVCDSPAISLVRGEQQAVQAGDKGSPSRGPGRTEPTPPAPPTGSQSEVVQAAEGLGSEPATAPPATGPAVPARRKISLGELELRGGSVKVVSHEGETVMRIDGLRMSFDFSDGETPGTLSFDRAQLLQSVDIENFVSPVQLDGRQMKLIGFDASCGGGELGGEIAFEYRQGAIPFVANLIAREIDAAKLVDGRALGLQSGMISSRLVLQGLAQSPKSIRGQGELWVDSAVIQPGNEFEKLRSALQVNASGKVELDPARAVFAIRGGNVELQEASFGSGQLLVKSVGGIRADGALNVAARLYLGAELYSAIRSKPVPGRASLQFKRLEGTDWFYRDELVTGTLVSPLVDFWRTGRPVPAAEVMGELNFEFSDPQGDSIGR